MLSLPSTPKKRSWVGLRKSTVVRVSTQASEFDVDCTTGRPFSSLCLINRMYTWFLQKQKFLSFSPFPFISAKEILSYKFSQERENDFQFLDKNLAPWRKSKTHSAAVESAKNILCTFFPIVLVDNVLSYFSAENQYLTHLFQAFFQGLTMELFLQELSFFNLLDSSEENCLCVQEECIEINGKDRKCDKHDHQCVSDKVVEAYISIFHLNSSPKQHKWFGQQIEQVQNFSSLVALDFHPLRKTTNTETADRKRKQCNDTHLNEKESEKKIYPFTYYFISNKGVKSQVTSIPRSKMLHIELEHAIIQAQTLHDICFPLVHF